LGSPPRPRLRVARPAAADVCRSRRGEGQARGSDRAQRPGGGEHGKFLVRDSKYITILINLLNGNLVLPKRVNQLNAWISIHNSKKGKIQISHISTPDKLSLNSAWISG